MHLGATIANLAWATVSLPAYQRFRRALENPRAAQLAILRQLVADNRESAFGREHGFARIENYGDFVARVPWATYDDVEPWITRIRRGESQVLTSEPVTRLVPTSGSTGARKLIPFTAGLQRGFNAAIGPWMVDLFCSEPALVGGSAYWSITPASPEFAVGDSAVPIGFADDAAYLGGIRRRLVNAIMAVPPAIVRGNEVADFRRATLEAMLRRPDLRLISVWHPSFLTLLLDDLAAHWGEFVRVIPRLLHASPADLKSIWPELRIVSCWMDGHAAIAARDLAQRLPGVRLQAKGLLATEAFVTLPFAGEHPLAIASHFFEFLDADSRVHLADELQEGAVYEVVVTTAGGLWRYRLGDQVRVERFVARTPSLRFLGRVGGISDRRGEKLAESFVTEVLRHVLADHAPRFALLAPEETEGETGCRYVLFVERDSLHAAAARQLDAALRANPHYAWCRELGQLGEPEIFCIEREGFETFTRHVATNGRRMGDIKPVALSSETGWSQRFCGRFVSVPVAS